MCVDESFFNELTKVEAGFVPFGDDSKVVGIGQSDTYRRMDGLER